MKVRSAKSSGALAAVVLAAALGLISAAQARPRQRPTTLLQILAKDVDAARRESAALLLGRAGNVAARPALERALAKDPARWVRARAAEALGILGERKAIPALKRALGREKNQMVRKDIARALLQLGARSGLLELMWQLKAGRNHERAAAMLAIVQATGQPLGAELRGWWTYLARRGYAQVARRRGPWRQLALAKAQAGAVRAGNWSMGCVSTLELGPTRRPLTRRLLRAALKRRGGGLEDGCLLLLSTRYQRAATLPARRPPRDATGAAAKRLALPADAQAPALTLEGLRFLLAKAPKLAGVALDTPRLDLPGPSEPVRAELQRRKLLGLVSVAAPRWLAARQRRLMTVHLGPPAKPEVLLLVQQ